VDITTDNETPVLAVCNDQVTAEERSNWVRQLQIPMIYRDGDNRFMLIYRTPVGATATQPLDVTAQSEADKQVEAATKARKFLAEQGHEVLYTYEQDKKDYNKHESDNLMNIVAVIYGVALTAALINRPNLLLRPVTAPHRIPSLALLVAGLLTALTFYGYVLSIGGDRPYDVVWTMGSSTTKGSSKPWGIVRFFVDLILASLYVHLLFVAVHVTAGPNTAPKLAGFVFAFIPVFVGAIIVRSFRGRFRNWANLVAFVAAVGTFFLWYVVHDQSATRGFDLAVEGLLLALVLLYGVLNHWIAYRTWKDDDSATVPPKP
jgi:hypothetical protein